MGIALSKSGNFHNSHVMLLPDLKVYKDVDAQLNES